MARPLPAAAALLLSAALVLAAAASATGEMRTTNAMPRNGGRCRLAPCRAGALFASALTWRAGAAAPTGTPAVDFSYALGRDFGWGGWEAGRVPPHRAEEVALRGGAECVLRLRGVTVLRLAAAMVQSQSLAGRRDGATPALALQYDNLRIRYSTALPPARRLLGVGVVHPATRRVRAVDPRRLYVAAVLEADARRGLPYSRWTNGTAMLDGESLACGPPVVQGVAVTEFLLRNSPYTIPDTGRWLAAEGAEAGPALVVEQSRATCLSRHPPQQFVSRLAACAPITGDTDEFRVVAATVAMSAGLGPALGRWVAALAAAPLVAAVLV